MLLSKLNSTDVCFSKVPFMLYKVLTVFSIINWYMHSKHMIKQVTVLACKTV